METEELLRKTADSELFRLLDIGIESAELGHVVLTMPVTPRVHQYIGIMNGGVSMLLAESAASVGAVVSYDLTKVTPVGIEINGNHVRAVSKGVIRADARAVYQGRTLSVWQIDITDERGRLVCTSRCTLSLRKGAAPLPTD